VKFVVSDCILFRDKTNKSDIRERRRRGTNDLILYVAVTQFQTEKVLKRLAQRLVEVEMSEF